MKLNHRIQALALGFAVVAAGGLSVALAEDAVQSPAANTKQEHAWGGKHHGKHGGKHKGCGAMKQLGLSEAQKTKLQESHKAFREQNAAAIESMKAKHQQLRQLGKDPANDAQRKQLREQLKEEGKALRVKREASMQGILTHEQQKRWETLKQECKAKHMAKRAERKSADKQPK